MRLSERTDVGPRCPYCREGLGADAAVPCGGCGVRLHEACGKELGRCPTMGCAGEAASEPLPGARPQGGVGQAVRREASPSLSAAAWIERAMIALLLLSVGVALILAPELGLGDGARVFPPIGVALLVGVLSLAGYRLAERLRARRFLGGELSVQPCPARPGAPVRLTLSLPPALRDLVREDPTLTLRAELRRVQRSSDGELTSAAAVWRAVRLASGEALRREGRAVFAVEIQMRPRDPSIAWEVQLSSEPALGFDATWEVPVRE